MSLSQHMDLPAIDLICLQGVLLEEYRLYNTEKEPQQASRSCLHSDQDMPDSH